jgi:ribosome-binding factor A
MLKVNSTLREVLAEEVERMSDSRLEMVSITGVETSPNLRHAVVYIDVLGNDASDALSALQHASHRLQSVIGRQVGARVRRRPRRDRRGAYRCHPSLPSGRGVSQG